MNSLIPLVKKDLRGYFDQPTGYILIVIFVGVISYLFFFVSAFNSTSEASVRDLFTLLPWLLALFVPASTMRLLAEEQRDGTLEILLTQPIRGWVVLAAKFVSGMVFVSVAIIATIGIPIALETVGNLEGEKVFTLYHPSMRPYIERAENDWADLRNPIDAEAFPRFRKAVPAQTKLKAGEIIYIPRRWPCALFCPLVLLRKQVL